MGTIELNWQNTDSILLLNPEWPEKERKSFEKLILEVPQESTVWVATSGSSAKSYAEVKLVALKKSAFLSSARSVNAHLRSTAKDIWGQVLPTFHVGGLGVEARAHLSGAKVVSLLGLTKKWSPEVFCKALENARVTLTSLVPTQVYDLVKAQKKSPRSLRAVVVGGGALDSRLYAGARQLGWPLLPSYGLTEACSQVATAALETISENKYPDLSLLWHIMAKTDTENRLFIKGDSLFSGYAYWDQGKAQFIDPKDENWFRTEDFCKFENGFLRPLGRRDEIFKVGGENVSLPRIQALAKNLLLEPQFANLNLAQFEIVRFEDDRLGSVLKWVIEESIDQTFDKFSEELSSQLLPFEKPREVLRMTKIPRSALGKPLLEQIRNHNFKDRQR